MLAVSTIIFYMSVSRREKTQIAPTPQRGNPGGRYCLPRAEKRMHKQEDMCRMRSIETIRPKADSTVGEGKFDNERLGRKTHSTDPGN